MARENEQVAEARKLRLEREIGSSQVNRWQRLEGKKGKEKKNLLEKRGKQEENETEESKDRKRGFLRGNHRKQRKMKVSKDTWKVMEVS